MSEESFKKSTKRHRRNSERDSEKGLKAKKGEKSGTTENSHDLREDLPKRTSSAITKFESIRGSMLTRSAGDQLSGTLPDILGKVEVSRKRKRKRKRTDYDVLLDESVNSGTDVTERKPKQNKKRDEFREEDDGVPYPNPAIDESLSEQSRRALSYAYGRCRKMEVWKFNKARQNWLLRNVWSEQAVPESYIPLVIGYLVGIRGGAREKMIDECTSKSSTSEKAPVQGAQPSDDGNKVNQSRALSILDALRKDSLS